MKTEEAALVKHQVHKQLQDLDGWLSSTSPGSYVNMTLCSLCPLPSLRTSVDLLRTVWPVDEHHQGQRPL
ncbi:hypothetical protein ATANTOWER_025474 [Ataeniobius toweri]|uniref:Uncharacterized protein n=1 Tax=Ataeniobius toweri TaxID=208326 RepID=A0ABU7AIZ2_9TELE|nr:hypothetical protein [Ataeniobius toweri]